MMKLSANEIRHLAAILADTLDEAILSEIIYGSTGIETSNAYSGRNNSREAIIKKLLMTLEEKGLTEDFLSYAYVHLPGRDQARAAIAKLCPEAAAIPQQKIDLSAQIAGEPQFGSDNAFLPGLQRNVRPYLAKLDVHIWRDRLVKIERQVCRVELEGNGLGTGFLVGPDTVLTNWHVFEIAKDGNKFSKIGCRFDYTRLPDGSIRPGRLVMLNSAIDTSPYSPAEMTDNPDNPPPNSEQLDYALLRLTSRVGEDQIDGVPREWIKLPKAALPLPAGAPILILQHPDGSPMKLALDTEAVIGLNDNGTRLRYRTNTEYGSSGSPVFTMDWDVVALHHYGDPKWQSPLFNQGVPIELIRQRIEANGFGAALGA